jgi:hypothetical protein
MNAPYTSFTFFFIITLLYFFAPTSLLTKKSMTLYELQENINVNSFDTNLIIYIVITFVIQSLLNILFLSRQCETSFFGSMTRGIGLTIIPWFFVFGITVLLLMFYPQLKFIFSNVIGYFFVTGQSYDFFNRVIQDGVSMKQDILNNTSSVINEMSLENFGTVVEKLKPIMTLSEENNDLQELLDIVSFKENVGEACWYLLAGSLAIMICYQNLLKKGCVEDVAYMRKIQDRIREKRGSKTLDKPSNT